VSQDVMEREVVGMGSKRPVAGCALDNPGHELGIFTEGTPLAIRTETGLQILESVIAIVTVPGLDPTRERLITRALPGKDVVLNYHFERLEIKLAHPETDNPEEAGGAMMNAANRVSNAIAAANSSITDEAVNWMEAISAYGWEHVDGSRLNRNNPIIDSMEATRKEALALIGRTVSAVGQVLDRVSGCIADKKA
ncbi:MAG: hypothetical protein ABIH29_06515, partial [Candidatus Micrarchaeota archaeon]